MGRSPWAGALIVLQACATRARHVLCNGDLAVCWHLRRAYAFVGCTSGTVGVRQRSRRLQRPHDLCPARITMQLIKCSDSVYASMITRVGHTLVVTLAASAGKPAIAAAPVRPIHRIARNQHASKSIRAGTTSLAQHTREAKT